MTLTTETQRHREEGEERSSGAGIEYHARHAVVAWSAFDSSLLFLFSVPLRLCGEAFFRKVRPA
jgi:hypothetical protein